MATNFMVSLYKASSQSEDVTKIEAPYDIQSWLQTSTHFNLASPEDCVYEWCYAAVKTSKNGSEKILQFDPPSFTGWADYTEESDEDDVSTLLSSSCFSTCGCDWQIVVDWDEDFAAINSPVGGSKSANFENISDSEPEFVGKMDEMVGDRTLHSNCLFSDRANDLIVPEEHNMFTEIESPYGDSAMRMKILSISEHPNYNNFYPVVDRVRPNKLLWAELQPARGEYNETGHDRYKILKIR